jgi:hypothetical protein
MAHEITATDTMFSVGTTPWHGLGTVLDSPPTVAEALRLAGLDWTVRTEPISAWLPDADGVFSDVTVPGKAVIRDTDNAVLGVVGAKFNPLQNAQALAWFQPWLDSGRVTVWALVSVDRATTKC